MVKVTKWNGKKKKEDWAKYRAELKKNKYGIIPNLIWAMREIWLGNKATVICCFVFAFSMFLWNLSNTYVNKYVVDLVTTKFDRRIFFICVGVIFARLFFREVNEMSDTYLSYVGFAKPSLRIKQMLMKKCMTTDYENNENAENADKLNKALEGVQVTVFNTPINLRGSLRHIAEFFTYSAILSTLSIWLVPIVAIPAALCFFIERHKMMWIWNMSDNWQRSERQLSYIRNAAGDVSRAKDMRLFDLKNLLEKGFARAFKERMEWLRQQDAWEFRHNILRETINSSGRFAAYAYVIYLVMRGSITPGDFVLYFNSIMQLYEATSDWFNNFSGYQWISNNINYVRAYLEMEDKTNRGEGKPLPTGECEIEFRNVTYKYFGADEPTIKNLSFTLHKGEKLALVGLNGAGKTTVIKLICGMYDPTEGEITLNGIDISKYSLKEYTDLFSVVFQDSALLAFSIGENVAADTEYDIERADECVRRAGFSERLNEMPQGLDTCVYKYFDEKGVEISGGEAQKLCLARAVYKGSPFIILDEPTAALDPISEYDIYTKFNSIVGTRTAVYISHRLSSCRFCDNITVLDKGKIAERGSHKALLENNGVYAKMWNAQAEYYKDTAGELFL